MAPDKLALRAAAAAARAALTPEQRAAASHAINTRLLARPEYLAADAVLLYVAMRGEVDPAAVAADAQRRGKLVAFPCVDWRSRLLTPIRLPPLAALCYDRHGVPTVSPELREGFAPDRFDLVLVPGLAFDPRGYRLGYGGGFYDRLLPTLRPDARRWALAFELQVGDNLPAEPHDVPLDAVITEVRWLDTGGRQRDAAT